jgi:hypothetical protein
MGLGMIGSAHVAQAVERVLGKDEVTSSTLVVGSRFSGFREKRNEDGEREI